MTPANQYIFVFDGNKESKVQDLEPAISSEKGVKEEKEMFPAVLIERIPLCQKHIYRIVLHMWDYSTFSIYGLRLTPLGGAAISGIKRKGREPFLILLTVTGCGRQKCPIVLAGEFFT